MTEIDLKSAGSFGEDFIDIYLKNGLGSLTKRDVDVLVLFLLIKDGRYDLPKDIFKACRELKLTEARVRNLYQEVQFKYMQYDESVAKQKFVELVENGLIEQKSNKLTFIVREPLLRQYFEEWVAAQDGFTDSSFNKNLVTVSVGTFEKILYDLMEVDYADIQDKLINELAPLSEAQDNESLLKMFVKEFFKSAGKEAGSMSMQGLGLALKMFLFGN